MNGMPIGADPTLQENEETVMALVCTLYEQGALAECFRLLLRLSAAGTRTAPLLYNEALCLERAGQRERAISCLEKALSCLKGGKGTQTRSSFGEVCMNNNAGRRGTVSPCGKRRLPVCPTMRGSEFCVC